jgi:hypothetical protein
LDIQHEPAGAEISLVIDDKAYLKIVLRIRRSNIDIVLPDLA